MESPKHGLVRYIYPSFVKVGVRFDGTEKVWPCFRLRPFEPPVIPMEGIYSVYFLDRTGMQTKGDRGFEGIRLAPFRYVANIRTAIEENPDLALGSKQRRVCRCVPSPSTTLTGGLLPHKSGCPYQHSIGGHRAALAPTAVSVRPTMWRRSGDSRQAGRSCDQARTTSGNQQAASVS